MRSAATDRLWISGVEIEVLAFKVRRHSESSRNRFLPDTFHPVLTDYFIACRQVKERARLVGEHEGVRFPARPVRVEERLRAGSL